MLALAGMSVGFVVVSTVAYYIRRHRYLTKRRQTAAK